MIRINPIAASWGSTPKVTPKPPPVRLLREGGKALAHADAFASFFWVLEMAPAAVDEDDANHDSQQEQSAVSEFKKLEKHASNLADCTCYHFHHS